MDKKLNNLLGYKDYSLENMNKKAKTTKRTEVAKDVINESHLDTTLEQKDYICKVVNNYLSEDEIQNLYEIVEDMLEAKGIDEEEV